MCMLQVFLFVCSRNKSNTVAAAFEKQCVQHNVAESHCRAITLCSVAQAMKSSSGRKYFSRVRWLETP